MIVFLSDITGSQPELIVVVVVAIPVFFFFFFLISDTAGRHMSLQSPTSPSFRDIRPSIRRRGLKFRPWPTGNVRTNCLMTMSTFCGFCGVFLCVFCFIYIHNNNDILKYCRFGLYKSYQATNKTEIQIYSPISLSATVSRRL